jgi:hypothetical protein
MTAEAYAISLLFLKNIMVLLSKAFLLISVYCQGNHTKTA